MKTKNNRSSVYASTFGLYSRGSLFGKWFYFDEYESLEEMKESIVAYFKGNDDPEVMYQDFENLPHALYDESSLSESLFNFCKYVENNEADYEAASAFVELFYEWDEEKFTEKYVGEFGTYQDLGWHFVENGCLEIPENIEPYFDYEKYGRDCSFDLYESNHYYFYM